MRSSITSVFVLAGMVNACGPESAHADGELGKNQNAVATATPYAGSPLGSSGYTAHSAGPLGVQEPRTLYAALVDQTSTSAFSGPSGGGRRSLSKPASDNQAITGITIGERSDDPCYMQLMYKDVETGASGSTRTFDECDGSEGDIETRTLPDGAFVTGVRICLNDDRDKLKGIQLISDYAACIQGDEHVYLEPTGCSSVFHAGGQEYRLCNTEQPSYLEVDCSPGQIRPYIERTNCDGDRDGPDSDWESEVHCPAGKVATGMKLNLRDSGGDRIMYNGVALECDDLIPTE